MKIEECVKQLEYQAKEDKDFLWNHPEKGNEEFETSSYILKRLKKMGYNLKSNIVSTGILATINGNEKGPCVLFRSELDALEMDDNGRMKHTCGHDAHMTALLALAQLIMDNKDKIKGAIKLIFEPAEETTGGAKFMIDEGVLENPKVDYVFGIHFWSELKKNTFAINPNAVMASTDPFNITVYGKGGHGALPEKCIDPIYIASLIATNLQSIVGRNISSNENAVVAITSIHGGNSNNLIPERVEMKGICRTFSNETRKYIKKRIGEISTCIAQSMNGTAEVAFKSDSYPPVVNDPKITEVIKEHVCNTIGRENLVSDYKTMCSDDMAFFLERRPGLFAFVGCTDGEYFPQHTEKFCVDIDTILNGVQFLFEIVKKFNFK